MTDLRKQWEGETVVNSDNQGIHFRLGQYLGGSQGCSVFLTDLGTEIGKAVIKLFPADAVASDGRLARWRRGAELSHPHLLRLFHTGRCRIDNTEMLFAVMEYAEEDLSQILPERPLSAAETLDMLRPALEALAYLHGRGLVHGRLKPANIMAVNDQLKLANDGLCTAGGYVAAEERSPYDPPETCGSIGAAGTRIAPAADIWSLGMTLAEVLTQQRPDWKQDDQEDPVIPQSLPEPFQDVVRNCLRRDPQQRWTTDQIASRLLTPSLAPRKPGSLEQKTGEQKTGAKETGQAQKTPRKWLVIVPAAVASFAAALFAGSGILHRQQPAPLQAQTQLREDARLAKAEPSPEASEGKPSPATPMANDFSNDQHYPKVVEASLPSSSVAGEINTTTSTPRNGSMSDGNDGVVQRVLPDVAQKARDTIQGKVKVKVRVHVDAPGDVVEAEFDSPGLSKYFAQLALQAAQRWKFAPAQSGAEDASREWLLRFEFGSTETKVFPSLVAKTRPKS